MLPTTTMDTIFHDEDQEQEEEKLVQMVHDFLESDSTPPTSNSSSQPISINHSIHLTLQGIVSSVSKAEMEVHKRVLMLLKYVRKSTCEKRRLTKWLRMDGYNASFCISSWDATFSRLGGDYDYIDIMIDDDGSGSSVRLIVDIDFKSQFELARPTAAYTELFNTLPSVYVGTEEKLCKIISLLCPAAKESLKERGLHIPPWRKASYMQSKWLCCCQKISKEGGEMECEVETGGVEQSHQGPRVKPMGNIGPHNGSFLASHFARLGANYC